jgi:uncharacterized membrane protein/ribosomal protein L40E
MDNTIGGLPKVRFGEWIGEGWNMFAEQWKVWVLNALVLSLVTIVPLIGIYIAIFLAAAASAGRGGVGLGMVMLPLMSLAAILIIACSTFLIGGMYRTAFKQLRGEPISTGDLFSAGDRFLPLLGASIVIGILVMIGAALCVIPAFIVAGALYFTLPLVVERGLGVGEAIQRSRDATRGDLFMFVLFTLVVLLLAQAGSYLCYVGLLVTWPLQFTIAAVAYRDCFGVPGARSFASKAAPPNAYGATPAIGYQPASPQQSPDYGSAEASPSTVYEPPIALEPPSTAPHPQAPTEPVRQTPTRKIVCPDCHAELPATARFCARCGRSLIAP